MGDSFGSGTGAGDYQEGTAGNCFRSANSYSEVVVKKLRERGRRVNFTNVTCSGSAISTLRQSFKGESPQFDALKWGTDLVLLSIGGTDIGFAGYGGVCIQADCSGEPTRAILDAMPQMGENLTTLLRDIQERSPRAKIILTGYGRPLTAGPNAEGVQHDPICDPAVFTPEERRQGNTVLERVDATLRSAADAARAQDVNVDFVSPFIDSVRLQPSFEGHALCESGAPFYRGLDALGQEGPEAILHLNRAGQAALADLVRRNVPPSLGHGGFLP
ncbi:SGNH/GDSL hydrolase family protein [Thermopolyspora sp. NPDC052614]|uniref:SGNH/GDSL hydrolase family protein n=1 Tax=Thermopolyspora sp. NPDC052614 TaxID=3155682 RepID=UPI00342697D5